MKISFNWLSEYLPELIDAPTLSKLLTSIGLEVENMELYESHKGGLKGLVIGEVISTKRHPDSDKLILTTVNVGEELPLSIVCGAANVKAGQKVVVAPVGETLYPLQAEPITIKVAKIRGVESYGMICAEDEIGLSDNHSGIIVLPDELKPGSPAAAYFKPFSDWVFEIGLTPNRMDAMSHLGIAKDVCAYLNHHTKKEIKVKNPLFQELVPDSNETPVNIIIENKNACQRYSGVSIIGIKVGPSPKWIQDRLKTIGIRPINNVVDITNFVLHETGQPLHAFDLDAIKGRKIIVKNLKENSPFITLDGKERKLSAEDLMICNGSGEGMCLAGVFGGFTSGVKKTTQNVFLESAWFNPMDIRKTSLRHGLRTEAAIHFEKNVDISNTVDVLKRASLLIKKFAGGTIASDIIDVYPEPKEQTKVRVKYNYLKKLSGKTYQPETAKQILDSLDFKILNDGVQDFQVAVPFAKPDVSLPADVVEEIMRIDGYDNIAIPTAITISPSIEGDQNSDIYKEKLSGNLTGLGFHEIFTNSITNSEYFDEDELVNSVRLLNNLSIAHNIMRPSLMETGLEAVAYNLNRKNHDLKFYEFGKTYGTHGIGKYFENEHLCLYITGNLTPASWKNKEQAADIFYLKGVLANLLQLLGLTDIQWSISKIRKFDIGLNVQSKGRLFGIAGRISKLQSDRFDIKQPVFFADLNWEVLLNIISTKKVTYKELPKQLPVHRDLAMIVPKTLSFETVETTLKKTKIEKLREIQLFDIFESEKLGLDKKSLALSFTFLDEEKTLTDKEIDGMMTSIMKVLESDLGAEIRK